MYLIIDRIHCPGRVSLRLPCSRRGREEKQADVNAIQWECQRAVANHYQRLFFVSCEWLLLCCSNDDDFRGDLQTKEEVRLCMSGGCYRCWSIGLCDGEILQYREGRFDSQGDFEGWWCLYYLPEWDGECRSPSSTCPFLFSSARAFWGRREWCREVWRIMRF